LTQRKIPEDFRLQHCCDNRAKKILCHKIKLLKIMQGRGNFFRVLDLELTAVDSSALLAPTVLHINDAQHATNSQQPLPSLKMETEEQEEATFCGTTVAQIIMTIVNLEVII
jgi:hypothetical protein